MTPDPEAQAKEAAARHAVARFISPGMRLGLGSGSTAAFVVRALAERRSHEELPLAKIVSTSRETQELARSLGIPIDAELTELDLTIDGADEFDPAGNLIKGGGGALVREKLVASVTAREIIVVDARKQVGVLGTTFPLPVAVVPFAWELTKKRIETLVGRTANRRETAPGQPFVTDDSLYILDIAPGPITDPAALERELKLLLGVVETGLFIGIAKNVVMGHADGTVDEFSF
jgi:ribose 5-phosphate isomerase A